MYPCSLMASSVIAATMGALKFMLSPEQFDARQYGLPGKGRRVYRGSSKNSWKLRQAISMLWL